jgi:hypothetical protein
VKLVFQNLDVFLKNSGYKIICTENDGSCLLASVIECLSAKDISVSIDDLFSSLKIESLTNFVSYSDSIIFNSTNTSADNYIHEKYFILKKGLENYVKSKMWATDIVDLIIPILANALKLDFLIFEPHSEFAFKFLKHVPSLHDSQGWIALKYKENHYDAIVAKTNRNHKKSKIIFYNN